MRYDERIIDQVQTANDIVEFIAGYLPLKRAGRYFKANCPFHGEKTPSFIVNSEKQIFHCFGCGAGGNVFGFLMRYENMSFPEALRRLAERANIVLPQATATKGEGPSESEQLYQLYQHAIDFYHAQFKDPVKGKEARAYFEKRGFEPELAEEFKMGWAMDGWRGLLEFLTKKGYKESLLQKSGLIFYSPKGHTYDIFRARLLFPIHNLQGKCVAFGGRALKDNVEPKYLNSPENPIFHKRRELFGLHLAKKFIDRQNPKIIVVEGYFGFMRLYQNGFKATVATLGTALGDDHVQLLKRFADEAIVVYDGDKAGEAAALRGLEVMLEGGMSVKIARLPSGFDPDDFIQQKGAEAFQKIISEARDLFDYKLEILLTRFNRADSSGLMRITNDFLETFLKVKNPVLLDRYLRRLAAALGVDDNSLRSELAKLQKKGAEREAASGKRKSTPIMARKKEAKDEAILFALALEQNHFREALIKEVDENDLTEPISKQLLQHLRLFTEGRKPNLAQILTRIPDEDYKEQLIGVTSFDWSSEDKDKAFRDCVLKLKKKRVDQKLDELRRNIAKAEKAGDQVLIGQYVKEYQALWRQSKS
jgi:DNA primase